MKNLQKIIDLLEKSIREDSENSLTSWWIIKDWYDKKVDSYNDILKNSASWLASYQNKLSEENNISNLKIKYTNISGYFIEIPKSQTSKIPNDFIHKQTLVNAARYITSELKNFEEKFLEAETEKANREYEIFLEIRAEILDNFAEIKSVSDFVAKVDFLSCLSQLAYENNYIKPQISEKYDLKIIWWKHPIVEKWVSDFISNDLTLTKKDFVHIVTWPNMWWKSTFLRQNALIILLAHMWSFVPAKSAQISLTDKIFSRVWASDNLFLGQSTFMVEMQEVANILNNSTEKSFVIIDEVGRWTSTYDGMSLAWAILKENHDKIKAKTLFATHYHELIDESKKLSWVSNYSLAVWENDENLVFLRKVIPWWIKKSFWLEVAKIAWIPKTTIDEAKKMLKILEKEHNLWFSWQLSLWEVDVEPVIKYVKKESKIEKKLSMIDVNNLTPIEALNLLSEMKKEVK